MVTFAQLQQADPGALAVAGERWQEWAKRLEGHGQALGTSVVTPLFQGDVWDDRAGWAADDHLEGLIQGVDTVRGDREAVAVALATASREIGDAQHLLRVWVDRARAGGLEVGADGAVFPPRAMYEPGELEKLESLARDCNARIAEALDIATRADSAAAGVLAAAEPLGSVQALNAESEGQRRAGGEAATLIRAFLEDGELSSADVERLRRLMATAEDPAFAAELIHNLGPDNVLELSAQLGSEYGDLASQLGVAPAAAVHTQLAQALASATDPANGYAAHRGTAAFTAEFARAATRLDRNNPEAGVRILGHREVGALLNKAEFSTEFLVGDGNGKGIAQEMYKFDVEHGEDAWPPAVRHHVGDDGGGGLDQGADGSFYDPMGPLMAELADNPEAARTFFGNQIPIDGAYMGRPPDPTIPGDQGRFGDPETYPVDRLLTDRDWGEGSPGTEHLGKALEAATIGEGRNAESAEIMSEVVKVLGTDEEITGADKDHQDPPFNDIDVVPPNMRDSMGAMLSGYIGDVHAGMAELPHRSGYDDPALPIADQPHAQFDRHELTWVLADTAKDESAHHQIFDAERAYARLAMEQHAGSVEPVGERVTAVQLAADVSGSVFGALDYGRGMELAEQYYAADAGHNSTVEQYAKLGSFATGEIASKIPGVGGAVDAVGQEIIAEVAERSMHDSTGRANYDIGLSYDSSQAMVKGLVSDTVYRNELFEISDPPPAALHVDGDVTKPLLPLEDVVGSPAWDDWLWSVDGVDMMRRDLDATRAYTRGYGYARDLLNSVPSVPK